MTVSSGGRLAYTLAEIHSELGRGGRYFSRYRWQFPVQWALIRELYWRHTVMKLLCKFLRIVVVILL